MVCGVEFCISTSHPTLLHVDPRGARMSPLGNVVASCRDKGDTERRRACLDIVPVCVSFGDAEISGLFTSAGLIMRVTCFS